MSMVLMAVPAVAQARTLHVRPGDALAAVAAASRPGDRIVVHAGDYTGNIRLKPRQRLIGRGMPRITGGPGDAVTLARRTTVRGLRIVGAERGAIYGRNVGRVIVRGNDVSGHNASCTPGFLIPPFNVPTTLSGAGVPITDGLHNGWAGIMVDATRGTRSVVIRGNRVHDAGCGDGIDVRAFKTAKVTARIRGNDVAELRQGDGLESVLAIGLQTSDAATMTARLDRNRQSGLGNDGGQADSEGVFVNPTGASSLTATVTRNTYTHTPGRGGFSANGLEFVAMGDGSRGDLTVRESTFSGTSGDVLEQLALGTNAALRMRLEDVVATKSAGLGNTVVIPGNNGDCLVSASGGAGNAVALTIRRSALTDCANNGLTFGSAVANGSGPTRSLDLDVSGSRITGNTGNNLRVGNVSALDALRVRVADTDLSGARGQRAVTPANASFENLGSVADSTITVTGSCLGGGTLGAAAVAFSVDARGNHWAGPPLTVGDVRTDPVLAEAPARCG